MLSQLSDFLNVTLREREWSQRELSRRSGMSNAQISDVINGHANAGANFCVAVARALNEAPEKLLRLAGILPPSLNDSRARDPLLEEMYQLYLKLPIFERPNAIRFLRAFSLMVEMGQGRPSSNVAKSPAQAERKENTNNPGSEPEPDLYAPLIEMLAQKWDLLTVEQMERKITQYLTLVWEHLPEHVKAKCREKIPAHLGE